MTLEDNERMTVEEFLRGFDPIDWKMHCLISNEPTEQEWIEECEQPFND